MEEHPSLVFFLLLLLLFLFLRVLTSVTDTAQSNRKKKKKEIQETSVLLSALSVTCFYIIGNLLEFSVLQFSHLYDMAVISLLMTHQEVLDAVYLHKPTCNKSVWHLIKPQVLYPLQTASEL